MNKKQVVRKNGQPVFLLGGALKKPLLKEGVNL